ncbi:MAG: helix-turn-helix transcriptional regulator [Verrucomicrobia bacterium]|nr:helix-turn-helix transcriptional regulator [Verrucomicrobiota bacterium]
MRQKLRKQLAAFLKKARGEMSYTLFAKRMGISAATLHRIEMCNQNVTVDMLEDIMARLKATMSDIFPGCSHRNKSCVPKARLFAVSR